MANIKNQVIEKWVDRFNSTGAYEELITTNDPEETLEVLGRLDRTRVLVHHIYYYMSRIVSPAVNKSNWFTRNLNSYLKRVLLFYAAAVPSTYLLFYEIKALLMTKDTLLAGIILVAAGALANPLTGIWWQLWGKKEVAALEADSKDMLEDLAKFKNLLFKLSEGDKTNLKPLEKNDLATLKKEAAEEKKEKHAP